MHTISFLFISSLKQAEVSLALEPINKLSLKIVYHQASFSVSGTSCCLVKDYSILQCIAAFHCKCSVIYIDSVIASMILEYMVYINCLFDEVNLAHHVVSAQLDSRSFIIDFRSLYL